MQYCDELLFLNTRIERKGDTWKEKDTMHGCGLFREESPLIFLTITIYAILLGFNVFLVYKLSKTIAQRSTRS